MLEDSLDWKVYRMLWAKTIKDNVFDALRYMCFKIELKSLRNIETSISIRVLLRKALRGSRKDMPEKSSQMNKSRDTWKPTKSR